MKKTISLVLALVMVFALASSASAITGLINPAATPASEVGPFTNIDLQVVEAIGTGFGLLSLQPVPDNKAYVKDGIVHFALYFKTPAAAKITMHADDYIAPCVLLSSDIVEFFDQSIQGSMIDAAGGTVTTIAPPTMYDTDAGGNDIRSRLFVQLPVPGPAAMSYVITGSAVVVGSANGVIQADFLGDFGCTKFLTLPKTIAEVIDSVQKGVDEIKPIHMIYSGKTPVYAIEITGDPGAGNKITYFAWIMSGPYQDYGIAFTTDYDKTIAPGSKNNVDKIELYVPPENAGDPMTIYRVNDTGIDIAGGGSSSTQFYTVGLGGVELVPPGDAYNRLKAAYDKVMNFFGLVFSREGILLPQHFGYRFSTFHATDSDSVNLYSAAITVPDQAAEIPQTGDAATSVGLVMIALAVLAACGAAYKKVRA